MKEIEAMEMDYGGDESSMSLDSANSSDYDDHLHDMSDIYGQTPPRERINRKQRAKGKYNKKQQTWSEAKSMSMKKKPILDRRNTMDAIIVSNLYDQEDKDRQQEIKEAAAREGSRQCKRILKINRGSERDLKLDVETANQYAENDNKSRILTNNKKIQGKNRFLSLRSKRIEIDQPKIDNDSNESSIFSSIDINEDELKPTFSNNREIFHFTFSQLINLGSQDKDKKFQCQKDREKIRWQNEVKDLIWLELQAYHADRSLVEQDEYLCKQRENIGELLVEIMKYKYEPSSSSSSLISSPLPQSTTESLLSSYSSFTSTTNPSVSNDSGYDKSSTSITPEIQTCTGCLSMYCNPCGKSQITALKQVESLLLRLEAAEALYPNSHAFALNYELYKSPEFSDRVKAMCLWYNITRHHRLKLRMLGRLLTLVDSGKSYSEIDSAMSTMSSSDIINNDNLEIEGSKIKFQLSQYNENQEITTSIDCNNSNINSNNYIYSRLSLPTTPESLIFSLNDDNMKINRFFRESSFKEFDRQAYRKYIEEVLKTRGLTKSLNFLDRLHNTVLRKASLTFKKLKDNEDIIEEYEDDWELRRYGVWSPEARELNLPSYKSSFIFLSRVPLDVIHEFLRLRLEQKPDKPEPLSVRQLMREMKEGIGIACMHRDRFAEHSKTVLSLDGSFNESFDSIPSDFEDVREFDKNLQSVFEVYLDYLGQWIEMVLYNNLCEKSIDAEWEFVKEISHKIKNGYNICGIKFCGILSTLINEVNEFLIHRPKEINEVAAEILYDQPDIRYIYMSLGREWQSMFVETGNKLKRILYLSKSLFNSINEWPDKSNELIIAIKKLKTVLLTPRIKMTNLIKKFSDKVGDTDNELTGEIDRNAKRTRIREIFHQAFRMGFDYYKKICELFLPDERYIIVNDLIYFAKLWMDFVQNRCERGRGIRPGWAYNGLKFLMIVCDPLHTKYLHDNEFEELKKEMDRCITHVIGDNSKESQINSYKEHEGFSHISKSSILLPAQSRYNNNNTLSIKLSRDYFKSSDININNNQRKFLSSNIIIDNNNLTNLNDNNFIKNERILIALKKLDDKIDEKRKNHELIGHLVDRQNIDKIRIKIKKITFTWQRGIRIGQGRFGKVYTVVNNQTGELLAMKEIQLQPGDRRAIRSVVEELQIFEGIHHKHLVRYYGMEIHREEMLIFMEFCAEGTLESLVEGNVNGLSEIFIRKYTHQLLLAVSILHAHGIVHRDIKSANIFLTDQGNCLKLGDFGSAVKIKTHTTMPGEVKGFVGTQAYMAPEVFMKLESGGHGRAADIWSIACCVIEMASGKRPWIEYDSNYQIMFKVGMGESPQIPDNLCQDGVDFIDKCLQHDPKNRPTANSLLSHIFIRNCNDINIDLLTQCVATIIPNK